MPLSARPLSRFSLPSIPPLLIPHNISSLGRPLLADRTGQRLGMVTVTFGNGYKCTVTAFDGSGVDSCHQYSVLLLLHHLHNNVMRDMR